MNPSDFTSFPMGSIMNKCEYETVAQNIMIILKRTGNRFRKLSWRQYKEERLKDGNFIDGEKSFFNISVIHCASAKRAKLFSPIWEKKSNSNC